MCYDFAREMRAVTNLFSQCHKTTSLFFSIILPETLKLTVLVMLFLWSSSKRAISKYKYKAEIDRISFKFIFGNTNRKFKLPAVREEESITRCRCSICLSEYIDGEEGRELQCKHRFHRNCLEKWVQECQSSATCPICRFLVLPKEKLLEYRRDMRNHDQQVGSGCEKEIAILLLSAGRHYRACNCF